jgi:hypothetical protein
MTAWLLITQAVEEFSFVNRKVKNKMRVYTICMKRVLFLILLFVVIPLYLFSQDTAGEKDAPGDIKVINNITIDPVQKEIRIACQLALKEGILEFFLVDEKGNTYESVFKVTENKPSELHFGLLLLGFEPVSFKTYYDLLKDPKAFSILKEKKCLLQCIVEKKGKQIPFSSFIANREENKETNLVWVFTGASFTKDNKYTADFSYSYMSIWPMMESVINLLSAAGNPYRGEFGYEMTEDITFLPGDDFVLIIKGVE